MLSTNFKDGILTISHEGLSPVLGIITVDDSCLAFPFNSRTKIIKASVLWNPISISAVEIPYIQIEKKLKPGEHKTKPKEYKDVPDSEFAGPGYTFPVNSESRVHAALAYFSKHPWPSESAKKTAARKILRAAKKFNVKVDKTDNVYKAAHS